MTATGDNSTLRDGFRRTIVDAIYKSFDIGTTDKYFLFAGKIDGWTAGQTMDKLYDHRNSEIDLWRSMVGMKQIDANSVYFMADKYVWESATVYDMYKDNTNLEGKKYYVMNSEYNVYKCLDNNNQASAVEPTGVKTFGTIQTSDGYVWKYMFTIPEPFRYYITDDLMPVPRRKTRGTSTESKNQWSVQSNAVDGSIDLVWIDPTSTLPNFSDSKIIPHRHDVNKFATTSIAGATTMYLATTHVQSDSAYNGLVINVTSGEGAGQRRLISGYSGGAYNQVFFTEPLTKDVPINTNYEITPRVQLIGDGVSCDAFADLYDYDTGNTAQNKIYKINVADGGKDYSYATVQISPGDIVASTTNSAEFSARAMMSPEGGHGADAVNELNCTAMLIVVDIDQTEDNNFFISNEIRQYGIIKNPVLNETAPLNIDGNPYRIAGSETSMRTSLEVTKTGTAAFLSQDMFTIGNYVIGKTSKATGKIEDWSPSLNENHGVLSISNLQGQFISPEDTAVTGEAVTEFSQSGDTWAFTSSANAEVSGFDATFTNTIPAYNTCWTLGVSGESLTTSTFVVDGGVTGGSGTSASSEPFGLCLSWTLGTGGTSGTLVVAEAKGTFNTGDYIGNSSASSTTNVINTITSPEIYPFSGEVIYAQNMKPIERDDEQREQYQIILKF